MGTRDGRFTKKPSTSELIDWIKALMLGGINVDKMTNELPFLGTLLKTEQDTERFPTSFQRPGGVRVEKKVLMFIDYFYLLRKKGVLYPLRNGCPY